ncbi:MAG TPA: hypothetical protein VF131_16810 [Blastocatellia bacterium]|nr:hypothetical protein [Blastocatellia bacterium]
MGTNFIGWIEALKNNDVEALWAKLFNLISKHSSVRMLYPPNEFSTEMVRDEYCDLTQDLFLRLFEKQRWQYYLDNDYSDERIQQELYRIEVPNMITVLQRDRHPESYRIARRISDLIKTRAEFQHFSTSSSSASTGQHNCNKMVLRLYGLSIWPADKPTKPESDMSELIKGVTFRIRDIRRTGRGAGSQVVISNEDLVDLIVDVFTTIDTPLSVRKMRALVMSKLPIEDSRMVSISAPSPASTNQDTDLPYLDVADKRPTPLETLLQKEKWLQIEELADDALRTLKEQVRNKPNRYNKLLRVVWHCYFDPASLSQTRLARKMGISDSLVSHYRGIFDSFIRNLELSIDEFILLNSALSRRLAAIISEWNSSEAEHAQPARSAKSSLSAAPLYSPAKPLSRAASRGA